MAGTFIRATAKVKVRDRYAAWQDRARGGLKRAVVLSNRLSEPAKLRLQPVHYYSEVPDRRQLRSRRPEWARAIRISGTTWDLDAQLHWLSVTCGRYSGEVAGLAEFEAATAAGFGPGFGPIESQVLHGVLRAVAPPRIVEVGSGVSTVLMRHSAAANAAEDRTMSRITCIEPFPRQALRALPGIELIEQSCQAVPDAIFDRLETGDLLFIDSTHAVRTGSEVARLYLEILPRLAPGIIVHIHDITLPYLFRPDILESMFDWQETTLLAALLTNNPALEVLACLSALHEDRPSELQSLLPDYRPKPMNDGLEERNDPRGHFPSSIWLRTRSA